MSRLVDFQNRIRRRCSPEWLSPSQKQTSNRLRELLSFQDTVNLHGPPGAGKTFMTWVLGEEVFTCPYFELSKLKRKGTDQRTLTVVDHHPHSRSTVRQTLSTLHGLAYKKILLVSDEPVADQIPSCQLALRELDKAEIYQNWSEVSIPVDDLYESFESMNLHQALREIALLSLATPGSDHL